ncbi:STM3941 family protein [Rhodoferax sp.]|uniref:STM3941 family protein n=1 Tax=Rhodoferax sp. TaxID=50421 RepID=UPI002ACE601F|nr:STM3941 family protein [Rhodoferax sp.]MDZ7921580.1 STM3941 family protein [Rhodoferax sp.]
MTSITFKSSKLKYAVLLFIAIFAVAVGVMMVTDAKAKDAWIGWGCIIFFGASIPLFAREVFNTQPRLILNGEGVFDRTLGVGIIPWTEITGATLRSVNRNYFICLEVHNPEHWTARMSPLKRAMVSANKVFGFAALNLNLSAIAADPMEVYTLVLNKAVASRARVG